MGTETRRRGQELEDALLTAAWEELTEVGYGGFTIDGVATRAGTSRPVIYRRWPTRSELAIAAVRHYGASNPVPVPDKGSVRDDLIELLRTGAARRRQLAVLVSVQMGEYFAETGRSPADLRDEFLRGRGPAHPWGLETVLRRGVERGEIDARKLTQRIATLPTDLLRHEMLMTLREVPDATIVEIVDDVFLPLVRPVRD